MSSPLPGQSCIPRVYLRDEGLLAETGTERSYARDRRRTSENWKKKEGEQNKKKKKKKRGEKRKKEKMENETEKKRGEREKNNTEGSSHPLN